MVQRSVHCLRGWSGRGGLLEKKDAAKDGTDCHVELALRSGEVHNQPWFAQLWEKGFLRMIVRVQADPCGASGTAATS